MNDQPAARRTDSRCIFIMTGAAGLTALAFRAQTAYAQPGASTGDASSADQRGRGGAPSGAHEPFLVRSADGTC
jgi:hypothetical protein